MNRSKPSYVFIFFDNFFKATLDYRLLIWMKYECHFPNQHQKLYHIIKAQPNTFSNGHLCGWLCLDLSTKFDLIIIFQAIQSIQISWQNKRKLIEVNIIHVDKRLTANSYAKCETTKVEVLNALKLALITLVGLMTTQKDDRVASVFFRVQITW